MDRGRMNQNGVVQPLLTGKKNQATKVFLFMFLKYIYNGSTTEMMYFR